MIHYVTGDMFAEHYDVRVNAVNCRGVMGAGLALQFKIHYPRMFEHYRSTCLEQRLIPGQIHTWASSRPLACVVNVATKDHWRDPSKLEWVRTGLVNLSGYLTTLLPMKVAVPALGCGLGGLMWTDVLPLIEEHLSDVAHSVYIFTPQEN